MKYNFQVGDLFVDINGLYVCLITNKNESFELTYDTTIYSKNKPPRLYYYSHESLVLTYSEKNGWKYYGVVL